MGVLIVIACLLGSALSAEVKNTYKQNCTCEPDPEEVCSSDFRTYRGECEMKCSNPNAIVLFRTPCEASDLYNEPNITSTQPNLTSTQANLTSTPNLDLPSTLINLTGSLPPELLMLGPVIPKKNVPQNEYSAPSSEANLISSTELPELETLRSPDLGVTFSDFSTLPTSDPEITSSPILLDLSEPPASLLRSHSESEESEDLNSPPELPESTTLHSIFTNVTFRSASNGVMGPSSDPNPKLPPYFLPPRNQIHNSVPHNLIAPKTTPPHLISPNFYTQFYPVQLPFLSTSPLLRYPSPQSQPPNSFYPNSLPPHSSASPRSIRSYPPQTNERFLLPQPPPGSQQPSKVDPKSTELQSFLHDTFLNLAPIHATPHSNHDHLKLPLSTPFSPHLPVHNHPSLQSLLSLDRSNPKSSPLYFYKPFPSALYSYPGSSLPQPKFPFSPQPNSYRSAEGDLILETERKVISEEAEHAAAKEKDKRLLNKALKEIKTFHSKKNDTKE